jgi:hypothetical protein
LRFDEDFSDAAKLKLAKLVGRVEDHDFLRHIFLFKPDFLDEALLPLRLL